MGQPTQGNGYLWVAGRCGKSGEKQKSPIACPWLKVRPTLLAGERGDAACSHRGKTRGGESVHAPNIQQSSTSSYFITELRISAPQRSNGISTEQYYNQTI